MSLHSFIWIFLCPLYFYSNLAGLVSNKTMIYYDPKLCFVNISIENVKKGLLINYFEDAFTEAHSPKVSSKNFSSKYVAQFFFSFHSLERRCLCRLAEIKNSWTCLIQQLICVNFNT